MTELLDTTPRRPITRPKVSGPEQSKVLLVATIGTIATALAVWLLIFVSLTRKGQVFAAWVGTPGEAIAPIGFQEEDASGLGPGLSSAKTRATELKSLTNELRTCLSGNSRSPIVVYLSAPGIDRKGRAVFVGDGGPIEAAIGPDAQDVGAILKLMEAESPVRRLLILDAGQVGSDWGLGVFGNNFVARVVSTFADPKAHPNLAVLISCAPGQKSWTCESERRSVFGHFVDRGLAGGVNGPRSLTVRELSQYVRGHVERWVQANRKAQQTPILLADPQFDFEIRALVPPVASPSEKEAAKKLEERRASAETAARKALADEWAARDRMEKDFSPYRRTPAVWRRYLDSLLRAERLLRAGRPEEADYLLRSVSSLKLEMSERSGGWKLDRPWSLASIDALPINEATKSRKEEAQKVRKVMAAYIDDLTGRLTAPVAAPKGAGEKTGGAIAAVSGPAKRAKVPLSLVAADDPTIPVFLEAQLLVWADVYDNLPGHVPFREDRGQLFRDGIDLRASAEATAEADDRCRQWARLFVDEGDKTRRKFQDALFCEVPDRASTLRDDREAARSLFAQGLRVVSTVSQAQDLLNRMAVELPYLADWIGASARDTDPDFERLVRDANDLADAVETAWVQTSAGRGSPEALKVASRETGTIEARIARLRTSHEKIRLRLQASCDREKGRGSTNWRAADDLLRVPLIRAEDRERLLEKVRSPEGSAPLADEDGPVEASSQDSIDDSFRAHALTLAGVECFLMKFGGASPEDQKSLMDALEGAKKAPGDSQGLDDLARFTDLAISGRQALALRLKDDASAEVTESSLVASARAAAVLPSAYLTASAASGAERKLDQFLRSAQLLWQSARLERDFAPEHADRLARDAHALAESAASPGLLVPKGSSSEVDRLRKAKLLVSTDATRALKLGDDSLTIAVNISTENDPPDGEASLLLEFDREKLHLVSQTEVDAGEASPVPVPLPVRKLAKFRRAEFDKSLGEAAVRATVFYRGVAYPASRPVNIVLEASKDRVMVSMREVGVRGWKDQFLDHPDAGYLHYGARLEYKLVFENRQAVPVDVVVERRLDDKPLEPLALTIRANGKVDSPATIMHAVDLDARTIEAIGVKDDEVPLNRPRVLSIDVYEAGPAKRLLSSRRRFRFIQEDINDYIMIQPKYDEATRQFNITLVRKTSDKVNGPLPNVSATITSPEISGTVAVDGALNKGDAYWFFFNFTAPAQAISYYLTVNHLPRAFPGKIGAATPPPPADAPKP